ncbi:transcriptional repressor TCF25-domain-containing protein [Xylariomycetidae sp. FL2044]|nr:transcriptional repressor TCF25-domain-containing protein [Xylariomycetidae sp. FL2044]
MSSRQLRKLQKQKELEAFEAQTPAEDSEESDDAPVQKSKPGRFSAFAALGGVEEPEPEDEDNDEDQDVPNPDHTETPLQTDISKSSSKKSKKKKKKQAKKPESTPVKTEMVAEGELDEIDAALRELGLSKKASLADTVAEDTSVKKAYERICELLQINTYNLKVINEMRNLFGRQAIAAAQNEEEEEHARSRRQRQPLREQVDLETFLKGQPGKTLPEVTLRRNPFLPGKETWPHASTDGLTMKQIKDSKLDLEAGVLEFGFAHDEGYNNLEKQFFTLVQMYDPMQLVYFLHRHPYHVSGLIQVSKVAKQDQNSALSADLCERALFTFGRVSLSAFRQKMEQGKARLDFRRPENRQFWLAGYHYLKSLVFKGTYRTALEWSKLLLGMDWSDPYGIIHFIHPMAIRAHESKWFIDFCDSEALDKCDTAQDYIRQTLVLARLQQKDVAGARALLLEGMERLPWLYNSLFKALNLDVPRAIWGVQPRDQHEELFTELYVHQTKGLWDNAATLPLLKEAGDAAKKSEWKTFSFPPVAGRNVARFIYLDNTPSLMGLVPGGMLSSSPNWEFDPLPPTFETNIFSYESQKLAWTAERGHPSIPGLPTDIGALRRVLQRAQAQGAPDDVLQMLREAIGEPGGEPGGEAGDEAGRNDDDDEGQVDMEEEVGGMQAMLQGFIDLFTGFGGSDLDSDDFDMPGGWRDDETDEDMPPLEPPSDNDAR